MKLKLPAHANQSAFARSAGLEGLRATGDTGVAHLGVVDFCEYKLKRIQKSLVAQAQAVTAHTEILGRIGGVHRRIAKLCVDHAIVSYQLASHH